MDSGLPILIVLKQASIQPQCIVTCNRLCQETTGPNWWLRLIVSNNIIEPCSISVLKPSQNVAKCLRWVPCVHYSLQRGTLALSSEICCIQPACSLQHWFCRVCISLEQDPQCIVHSFLDSDLTLVSFTPDFNSIPCFWDHNSFQNFLSSFEWQDSPHRQRN